MTFNSEEKLTAIRHKLTEWAGEIPQEFVIEIVAIIDDLPHRGRGIRVAKRLESSGHLDHERMSSSAGRNGAANPSTGRAGIPRPGQRTKATGATRPEFGLRPIEFGLRPKVKGQGKAPVGRF